MVLPSAKSVDIAEYNTVSRLYVPGWMLPFFFELLKEVKRHLRHGNETRLPPHI